MPTRSAASRAAATARRSTLRAADASARLDSVTLLEEKLKELSEQNEIASDQQIKSQAAQVAKFVDLKASIDQLRTAATETQEKVEARLEEVASTAAADNIRCVVAFGR